MRVYLFFICSILFSFQLFAESEEMLVDAVKSYQSLQKELDAMIQIKTPVCLPGTKPDPSKTFCSVEDFCSMSEIHSDDPILYQNKLGEQIGNEGYYQIRDGIRACLKEKYSDEIKEKRDALAAKLGYEHLKKIMDANKKLTMLTAKFNAGAKIQKISSEILTISLENGLKGTGSNSGDYQSRDRLNALITKAEKRSKTTLNPEIKKIFIEIEYLKNNNLYLEQVAKFEEDLIPSIAVKDPFINWKLLTDEKAAGGAKALLANRAKLTQKTQDAYGLFQETQKEILGYLESKKNETNIDKIERIIERVKTIRFNPPRLTGSVKDECKFANAFYSPDDHSFTVCPQMLDYPKMALMEVMAHEISHSYDSCTYSGKMYKTKEPMIVEEAPFEIEIKMDPEPNNYTHYKNTLTLNGDHPFQDKALYAENPFSKTLSCLQDPKSVGALSIKPEEIKRKTEEQLAELTRRGQNTPNNTKAKYLNFLNEHQEDYFGYFQGCDFSSNGDTVARSQMQEAFADKMAAEVVARKLKRLSKSEAEKSVLEIALTLGDICPNQKTGEMRLREFASKEKCPDFFDNLTLEMKVLKALDAADPEFKSHPESAIRIDRNLLAHPEIRKALKCPSDSGVKYCE